MAERLTTNQEVPGSTPGWIDSFGLLAKPFCLIPTQVFFYLFFTWVWFGLS